MIVDKLISYDEIMVVFTHVSGKLQHWDQLSWNVKFRNVISPYDPTNWTNQINFGMRSNQHHKHKEY